MAGEESDSSTRHGQAVHRGSPWHQRPASTLEPPVQPFNAQLQMATLDWAIFDAMVRDLIQQQQQQQQQEPTPPSTSAADPVDLQQVHSCLLSTQGPVRETALLCTLAQGRTLCVAIARCLLSMRGCCCHQEAAFQHDKDWLCARQHVLS